MKRDPEFTEEVEAESRRQAWVLHRQLYGDVSKNKFFVQDSRPFEAVRGHTASKAKLRYQKSERKYGVDSGASLHIIGW